MDCRLTLPALLPVPMGTGPLSSLPEEEGPSPREDAPASVNYVTESLHVLKIPHTMPLNARSSGTHSGAEDGCHSRTQVGGKPSDTGPAGL